MGHSTEFLVLMVGPFYLLLACWQFVGLATLADKHLCPTLERFCKSLELPTGLAGATLLAFGSSAPELAIASVSALTGRAAYAIATILASALIAFGLIPAVAVYLAGPLRLHVTGALRDALFYALALGLLVRFSARPTVRAADACLLILVYVLHVLVIAVVPAADGGEGWPAGKGDADSQRDDDDAADDDDARAPPTRLAQLARAATAPFKLVFALTVPRADIAPWHGFLMSVAWLALLSTGILFATERLAAVWGLSAATAGMTLLAFGAQIPDTVAAVELAREGLPDAAISQAVASQVINVSLGLGLPFLAHSLGARAPTEVADHRSVELLGVAALLLVAAYVMCMHPRLCGRRASEAERAVVVFDQKRALALAFLFAVVYLGSVFCTEEHVYLDALFR